MRLFRSMALLAREEGAVGGKLLVPLAFCSHINNAKHEIGSPTSHFHESKASDSQASLRAHPGACGRLWGRGSRHPGPRPRLLELVGVVSHGGVDEVLGSFDVLRCALPKGLKHGRVLIDQ